MMEIACALALFAAAEGAMKMPILPDGLGVNIHFTDPRAGEMTMLADGGFRWVRMDFVWSATEKEKGRYDFAAYDRLLSELDKKGIRALFILDYGNDLYDGGLSPRSEEARSAFARWAAAAVARFRGRGILWEMWNEPNIPQFWKPSPNADDYARLALAVGKAIRQAAPEETYIGPATSGIDFGFLESCFRAGLLEYWDAVSVHPYRQSVPETAAAEYRALRLLISRYAPKGKAIPILSGEWGYSSVWGGFDEASQGRMLPRQWLTNLANDIPLSIWYDWHDDGRDPKEPEHHFGTVRHEYNPSGPTCYEPKPAYLAARTLASSLAGFRFDKALAVGGPQDHVLLFVRDAAAGAASEIRLAAWTSAHEPRSVVVPASPGCFRVTGHTGEELPPLQADAAGLRVELTPSPKYLVPEKPNELLAIAAAWERAPLELPVKAPARATLSLGLRNPLSRALTVTGPAGNEAKLAPGARVAFTVEADVERSEEPVPLRMELAVGRAGIVAQETMAVATNPLRAVLLPPAGGSLQARIEDPSGEGLRGRAVLVCGEGLDCPRPEVPVEMRQGESEKVVSFRLGRPAAASYRAGLRILDDAGRVALSVPAREFRPVDDFSRYPAGSAPAAYSVHPDGDAKVTSEQAISAGQPREGPPAPGVGCLRLVYRFAPGWKFVRVSPATEELRRIEGRPRALGMWIHGDGQGNWARLRIVDSTGQAIQPGGMRIAWKGWRYVTFPLDGSGAGHWGGANDGVPHYPVRWDTLFLLDNAEQSRPTQGEVFIASPTLVF